MARPIDNSEDIIDSRDVIERIRELENDDDRDEQDDEELRTLRELQEEGQSATSEWEDGATLIRDSYFEDFARELADDIGAIDRNANWPLDCIDWEKAADELKMDYTSIDFDGVEYWVRS